MPAYISSNSNRFYCGSEVAYGHVPTISAINRIPAIKLAARQQSEIAVRKDKTGSRTFGGLPPSGRRRTTFELKTYMTTWSVGTGAPNYDPLFQATLGGAPLNFMGATSAVGSSLTTAIFTSPHGLSVGQGITYLGDLRFVASIIDNVTVQVNAPFSSVPMAGATFSPTVTYLPSTELPSVSVFDYWSPSTAVQRILCGAGVDKLTVRVNGDFHEFEFSGLAQELVDNSTFSSGIGQLSSFPPEPVLDSFDYSIVPGHMGQVWLGNTPDRFLTLTEAQLVIDNDLDLRAREFGSTLPRAISPGTRSVSMDFELYAQDDSATIALYQAAKQESPIAVMLQLGQQTGQLFGVCLKSVVPQVPEFDDSANRLKWQFRSSRAQGSIDDEIIVAFG